MSFGVDVYIWIDFYCIIKSFNMDVGYVRICICVVILEFRVVRRVVSNMLFGVRSVWYCDYFWLGYFDVFFLFKIWRNFSIDKIGDGSVSRSWDGSVIIWVGDGGRVVWGEKGEVMGFDDGIEGKCGVLLELIGGVVVVVDEDGRELKLEVDLVIGVIVFYGEEIWGRGVV